VGSVNVGVAADSVVELESESDSESDDVAGDAAFRPVS